MKIEGKWTGYLGLGLHSSCLYWLTAEGVIIIRKAEKDRAGYRPKAGKMLGYVWPSVR